MKSVIFLVLATTLVGSLTGCEYSQDRQYVAYQRQTDDSYYDRNYYAQPYSSRTYYSHDDYYRHYNGIDG
jgi:hypothetical protein